MASPDYYNILGVEKNATPDEIKRAYRALARRWHPDKNPDDADAARRFKDITTAYRTLEDPEERARYDRLGPLYRTNGRPPRPEDIQDVVSGVWNNIFHRGGAKGDDLRYTVSLTLEEVGSGTHKEVVVPRFVRCRGCSGTGAHPEGGKETCSVCAGSGKSSGRIFKTTCYHCGGEGYQVTKSCDQCGGDGLKGIEDTLKVKVPAGVSTGQKLKVAGKGNAPKGSGEVGDLFVVVSVADHPLFRRRGDDLLVELPLTFSELVLGGDVKVPTLDGSTTIRVQPGSEPGKTLRLGGRGLPRTGRKTSGDLHIELQLEVPTSLPASAKQPIADLATVIPPSCNPKRAAFDSAVEDRTP